MKTTITILSLLFFSTIIQAQNCILTNTRLLNTGCDYTTNTPLSLSTADPNWIITNATNIPGAINNTNAIVCNPNGGGASNPNAAWIGFATASQYVTTNPTIGFYNITFKYTFKTCLDDSLHFNMNMSIDNYISDVRIDGISIGFSQTPSLVNSNWQTFANYVYSNYYLTGTHSIEIDGQNFNVQNAMNPHLLCVYGAVTSNINSIVSNLSALNCNCNVLPDFITAHFNYAFNNPCDSSLVQFTDSSFAVNSTVTGWNWNFGDGNTSTLQNPSNNYATAGTYPVTLITTNSANHMDTFIVNITVKNSSINVTATANPANVCTGNATTLTGGGATSYAWSGGVTNGVSFIPSTTTTYTVVGTDANGCTASSTVTVQVANSIPINITSTNPIVCITDSTLLTATGAVTYSWLPTTYLSNNNLASTFAFPPSTTTYTVVGTDANGCTGQASTVVTVIPPISITVTKSNDIECGKKNAILTATGATNYTWSPANLVNNTTGASTTTSPSNTATIYVIGQSGTCVDMDSITVNVNGVDAGNIFVPTAFSPNGDGLNDFLQVKTKGVYSEFYFAIYNRWGQRVFETPNPEIGWEGHLNGEPAEEGVYFYYLKATNNCGEVFLKGDITLVR